MLLIVFQGYPAQGEIVFDYTFDEDVPSDFEVIEGSVIVENGTLVVSECVNHPELGNTYCPANMWINSTVTTGRWSLDYYLSDAKASGLFFFFVGEGASNLSGLWPTTGYIVFIKGNNYVSNTVSDIQFQLGEFHNDGEGNRTTALVPMASFPKWMHLDIIRNDTGFITLYIDGELFLEFNEISPVFQTAEHMNIELSLGDRIDNLTYSTVPLIHEPITITTTSSGTTTLPTTTNTTVTPTTGTYKLFAVGIGAGFTGIGVYTVRLRKKKLIEKALSHLTTIETIANSSQNFELNDFALLTLMAKSLKIDDEQKKDIQDTLPIELLDYKYLMHPIRLTIIKLLEANDVLPSSEIREILAVTWGEYNSHLRSLEEKGFVEIRDGFDTNAQLKVVVEISEHGRGEYKTLIDLLRELTEKNAPIRRVIGKNAYPIYNTDLYPKTIDDFE